MLTFEKVTERDIDFIIMRAFSYFPDFAELFLSHVGWSGAKVTHIEHSLTDTQLGESDITVFVELNGKQYALLIENKIDAQAMPNQYKRYCQRGDLGKKHNKFADYAVIIVAPQTYLSSNIEAQKYPHQVSYETLLSFFEEKNATFDCIAIRRAINKQKSKYVVHEIPAITLFWEKLYQYIQSTNFKVEMYPPNGAKGFRSTWVQFRTPLCGTSLFFKSENGYVDLEFSGKLNEATRLKSQLQNHKAFNMHWWITGKSISLRIHVSPINFQLPFEECIESVDVMLRAVEDFTTLASNLNDIDFVI